MYRIFLQYTLKILLFIGLLFPQYSPIFAQTDLSFYEKPSSLDYVAINNEVQELDKDGIINVKRWDVVKIAGFGKPESNVTVSFLDKSYKSTVDEQGNWFLLFSVMEQSPTPVNINVSLIDNSGERVEDSFFSILIKNEGEEKGEFNLNKEDIVKETISPIYILIPITVIVSISVGWYLGSKNLFIKKGKNK